MSKQVTQPLFPARLPRAEFSACTVHSAGDCYDGCRGRRYRYQLWWPTGLDNGRIALGIFANPSTATADKLDPTLTRWRNYCARWGFGWAAVGNLRAWRETNPDLLPGDELAIGRDNDWHLTDMVRRADLVVCGWGCLDDGIRGPAVLELIRNEARIPHALKLTKSGEPGHPLYLKASLLPMPMGVSK